MECSDKCPPTSTPTIPILQAGVISQLRMRAEIDVVESGDLSGVDVGIAVADTLDDETVRILRALKGVGQATRSW